jgi:hypothetical protein
LALIEEETLVAVAATAAALSPRVRKVARKGAVYGLAGVLKAGDVMVAAARGAARAGQSPAPPEPAPAKSAPKRSSTRPARTRSARAKPDSSPRGDASRS